MHTTDTPKLLAELTSQLTEILAQSEALAGQIKAAIRREADLRQQLNASQAELSKLGFMQLGKKMMVRAEQDSIRKKLSANQQLQESLLARQQACRDQQSALEARIAQAHAAQAAQQAAPAPEAAEMGSIAPPKAPAARRSASAKKTSAPRTPHAGKQLAALPLEEQISRLLARLEAFYPEHQVFALDSICAELHGRLKSISARSGCQSTAEFLQKHGYTLITGAQGRTLRQGMYCVPGQEPEVIRSFLASVLRRLEKHYPDHLIPRSIQHDHKSLAQDVSGLYQWLGYASTADMLTAYGYSYQAAPGGRPATDAQALLDTLRAAYATGEKPRTIARLMTDHPELAKSLKTLQNQSPARFGMPLKQYLAEHGILAAKPAEEA